MRVSGSQTLGHQSMAQPGEESHQFAIRTLAVTPSRSREMDFTDVTEICFDYTINGLTNMTALANKPFRFVYTSGILIERDQSKSLPMLGDYRLMRVWFPSHLFISCSYDQIDTQVIGPSREYHLGLR